MLIRPCIRSTSNANSNYNNRLSAVHFRFIQPGLCICNLLFTSEHVYALPLPPPSSLAAHTRENNERMKPVHRATSSPPSSPSRILLAKTETRYICEHTRTHAMQLLPKAQHHCYQLGTDKQWQIEPLCLLWRVNKCELERSKMWPS